MGKEVARETWGSKLDFLLSAVGFAVGLGNIWRFPYLCYRNGGGAFLIPYVIMLLISGLPLFFFELALGQFSSEGPITVWKVSPMFYGAFLVPYVIMLIISGLPIFFFELALGQFSSEGPITLWKVCPLFYGIGWGMVMVSGLVCIYYNVIIMYAIYYMFVSFVNLDGDVPWIDCDNPWNTKSCRKEPYPDFPSLDNNTKVDELYKMMDDKCVNNTLTNMTMPTTMTSLYTLGFDYMNSTMRDCLMDLKLPSDEYWTRFVLRLHESDGIDNINGISLKNVICLFFAWVLIFFCLMKGIKSSGKVVYFTATFPYVLLIVLLVRGLTLPGFKQGVEFYIIPEWDRLTDPKVWSDAATQIFYSLGPAFGGLMCMSSFNQFKNNCFRDSLIVAFINCGTSVFGGFAIFSLLGFMAHTTNQPVEDVADSGPGLAFVAYPEGLARLPVSSLWSFLFFFMIITLGLDSQMVMMETVISGITDLYPNVLRRKKALFTFVMCMLLFVLGIPMTTKGGILVLTVFDWYSGSYNLMIIALCELVVIVYVYGLRRWMKDIEMMIGKRNIIFWAYYIPMWCLITPLAIIFILVMSGIRYTPVYYFADEVFPEWAQGIGWMLAMLPVACIFVGIIVGCVRYRGNLRESLRPKPDWGPRLKENRTGLYYADNYGYDPEGDEMPKVYSVDSTINAENGIKSTEFHKL